MRGEKELIEEERLIARSAIKTQIRSYYLYWMERNYVKFILRHSIVDGHVAKVWRGRGEADPCLSSDDARVPGDPSPCPRPGDHDDNLSRP